MREAVIVIAVCFSFVPAIALWSSPLREHSLIPAQRQCYSIVRTPGTSKVSPTAPTSRQEAGHRLNPEVTTGATLQRRRRLTLPASM